MNLPPYISTYYVIKLLDGIGTANSANVIVIAENSNSTVTILNGNVATVAGRVGDVILDVVDVSNAAPLKDPVFAGNVLAPTLPSTDSSSAVATTAFVQAQKFNPNFSGIPTAPTANPGTSTVQIATTAFVQREKTSPKFSGIPTAPNAAVGTNTDQIATTAFVKNSFSAGFGGQLNRKGYQVLPGNIIMQWGTEAPVDAATIVDFSVPFPTGAFSFTATVGDASGSSQDVKTAAYSGLTQSGVTILTYKNGSPSAVSLVSWIAIGY